MHDYTKYLSNVPGCQYKSVQQYLTPNTFIVSPVRLGGSDVFPSSQWTGYGVNRVIIFHFYTHSGAWPAFNLVISKFRFKTFYHLKISQYIWEVCVINQALNSRSKTSNIAFLMCADKYVQIWVFLCILQLSKHIIDGGSIVLHQHLTYHSSWKLSNIWQWQTT